jgi:hypothetical protein
MCVSMCSTSAGVSVLAWLMVLGDLGVK